MTKQALINWLISKGYIKDAYGNYRKPNDLNFTTYRFKIQDNSVRYEKQIILTGSDGRPTHEWLRMSSNYYKNLSVNDKGQLAGLKR
jgi:hypothetical protein